MPVVTSQIGTESSVVNSIFANKGNWGEILGHLFVTSSSSHFFYKIDLERYLLKVIKSCPKPFSTISLICKNTRGGVEDTRLKAKDTKKIRGQGQPFRGQTLSRPRTGMLEVKANDQGHSRKCSRKKKGLQKSFSGNF